MPKKVIAAKYPKGHPKCVPIRTYVRKVKSEETPIQEPVPEQAEPQE
tara:strand:+ start:567 stop:707 length:141 start_codon:yes stop_codon:yes gene_type:complete